jgi:hypothetical protein
VNVIRSSNSGIDAIALDDRGVGERFLMFRLLRCPGTPRVHSSWARPAFSRAIGGDPLGVDGLFGRRSGGPDDERFGTDQAEMATRPWRSKTGSKS